MNLAKARHARRTDRLDKKAKGLVGALGYDLFGVERGMVAPAVQAAEAPPPPSLAAAERFSFRGEGFKAEMKIGLSGEIILSSVSSVSAYGTKLSI